MERMAQAGDLKAPVLVSRDVIDQSLRVLKSAGRREHEGIVLWFAGKGDPAGVVTRVLEPAHTAHSDMFHIPKESIDKILVLCREKNLRLVAQVHSHPAMAFHSSADNRWAIPRHVGALSLVVPYFARRTSEESFMRDTKVFALTAENQWVEVPESLIAMTLRTMP